MFREIESDTSIEQILGNAFVAIECPLRAALVATLTIVGTELVIEDSIVTREADTCDLARVEGVGEIRTLDRLDLGRRGVQLCAKARAKVLEGERGLVEPVVAQVGIFKKRGRVARLDVPNDFEAPVIKNLTRDT